MTAQNKTLDPLTYGDTPGAMYLVRVLNQINSAYLNRSVGKRISTTATAVNELSKSYEAGVLSSKTYANTLRLMREEVAFDGLEYDHVDIHLVNQLRRNVQIGHIKRGIRQATVARKAEQVMSSGTILENKLHPAGDGSNDVYFTDSTTGKEYCAGNVCIDVNGDMYASDRTISHYEAQVVNSYVLRKRSDARCKRLGKNHTL
jgi:hypothetical protein